MFRAKLLNFHGMGFTLGKMCPMVKKCQTMIEAHVDVKTTFASSVLCWFYFKKKIRAADGVAQVVTYLHSKHKTLHSNPSTTKRKKKKRKKEK
jgi:hypothetical protein